MPKRLRPDEHKPATFTLDPSTHAGLEAIRAATPGVDNKSAAIRYAVGRAVAEIARKKSRESPR